MLFVFTAFLDPLLQQLDLFGCELAMRIGGRHAFIGILGGDTIDELALGEVARHDGACAVLPFRLRIRLTVQSQLGLTCRAIRPVTFVTIIRENGPDIAIKAEGCRRDGGGNHDKNSRRESHF